jgi:pyruvate dehydrogenase E1 component alpha subunit
MERETLHHMLRDMLLSRAFEERAAEEYSKGNIVGFLRVGFNAEAFLCLPQFRRRPARRVH